MSYCCDRYLIRATFGRKVYSDSWSLLQPVIAGARGGCSQLSRSPDTLGCWGSAQCLLQPSPGPQPVGWHWVHLGQVHFLHLAQCKKNISQTRPGLSMHPIRVITITIQLFPPTLFIIMKEDRKYQSEPHVMWMRMLCDILVLGGCVCF